MSRLDYCFEQGQLAYTDDLPRRPPHEFKTAEDQSNWLAGYDFAKEYLQKVESSNN